MPQLTLYPRRMPEGDWAVYDGTTLFARNLASLEAATAYAQQMERWASGPTHSPTYRELYDEHI